MGILDGLNPQQKEAAQHYTGPQLILAGAGSGKTRVLTHRIAWLIDEKRVNPWNILAITFTNKAAGEMRERVNRIVGYGADAVWVATFHSTCARILRRYIDCLGYTTSFAIYDTDDQKTLMKEVCKRLGINTKVVKERQILSLISAAKNELIGPEEFGEHSFDYLSRKVHAAYEVYQQELKKNNALDFDDLLMLTVQLFEKEPMVLQQYRDRFRFIMVDEYQDTNTAQFRLVSLLAGENGNLCVVGDDDQSIYSFRGANIQNILSFEKVYPNAKVVRLEQNYRSTQSILDVANAVISNNTGRKEKRLWTENGQGGKVRRRSFQTSFDEAEFIAEDIEKHVMRGARYGEHAVLYRTNAQSRLLEEKLLMSNIPYRIVGGVAFYSRKEIKDLLCYLKTVDNGVDDLAVRRIINVPRRGIGDTSVTKAAAYASVNDLSLFQAVGKAGEIPGIGRTGKKMEAFADLIKSLRAHAAQETIKELTEEIISRTGYTQELLAEGTDEAKERLRNIDELISKIVSYEENNESASLSGFLQEVSLVADIDDMQDEEDRVTLMTLHSAKGLEFPVVYMTGMEENLFPSIMSMDSETGEDGLEEERRLCYVGMTRAMRELTLTSAAMRMNRGERRYNMPSRFLEEIPVDLLDDDTAGRGISPFARRPAYDDLYRSTFTERKNMFLSGDEDSFAERSGETSGIREMPLPQKERTVKTFDPSLFKVTKADGLDYTVGDRVRHVKFGEGTVKNIIDGKRDYEVTVEFDGAGVKKMYAAFAKLQKM